MATLLPLPTPTSSAPATAEGSGLFSRPAEGAAHVSTPASHALAAPRDVDPQLALPGFSLNARPLRGRILELSGHTGPTGRTSVAVSLVVAQQRAGEPVVWIESTDGELYPPDLAAAGVDLDALVIVRIPCKEGADGLCKAAEWLLRSGGFGLVVMDFRDRLPTQSAWQSRLSGLLRRHDAQLCVLSESEAAAPSLGAMVGLRVAPERRRKQRRAVGGIAAKRVQSPPPTPEPVPGDDVGDGVDFVLEHPVLKNKLGLVGQPHAEARRAPPGLEDLESLTPSPQMSLFAAPERVGPPVVAIPPLRTRPVPVAAKRINSVRTETPADTDGEPDAH